MQRTAKIEKVLVVLSPDLVRPGKPLESALIRRAVALAKITGCELELFHVCFDGSLQHQLFTSDASLKRRREELTDRDATLLAEMATHLRRECIDVRHEVRWDFPRSDAILRKIAQAKPDIVMKESREHSYLLGITSNSDWDLARRSPAHVWLVNDEIDDVNRIVAAVGNQFGNPADVTTADDYELLQTTRLIADTFKAEVYPVNAYQVPQVSGLAAGMGAAATPVMSADALQKLQSQTVKQHRGAVKAFARYFDFAKENIRICEGSPNKVIPEVAAAVAADIIVMGASNVGRLERVVRAVTVEPVMATAKADILLVRDGTTDDVPDAAAGPVCGTPRYDLEKAITNPEANFESPQQVATLAEISIDLRKRILQAWEHDIRAEMVEENEGGPPQGTRVGALDEILSAKELLAMNREKEAANGRRTLHGRTA